MAYSSEQIGGRSACRKARLWIGPQYRKFAKRMRRKKIRLLLKRPEVEHKTALKYQGYAD